MADSTIPPVRGKKKIKKAPAKAPAKTAEVPAETKNKILERVAREEKAYRIVERLIDNPVSCQLLQKSLKFINQSVYNDIIDERSIIKNCGYPICENNLPKTIKKQKYGINTRLNKVYKLEDRVKFCSSHCYSCSRTLRDQLSPEPVWLMSRSAHKDIKFTNTKADKEDCEEALPINQKIDEVHLHEITPRAKVVKEKSSKPQMLSCTFARAEPRTEPHIQPSMAVSDITETVQEQFSWLNLTDENEEERTVDQARLPCLSLLGTIRQCLTQWRTQQSSQFLSSSLFTTKDEDTDDLDDDLLDDDLKLSPPDIKAPLPDIKQLDSESVLIKESDLSDQPIMLPKIDSINQVQQRQHIVILKLQPALDKILFETNISYTDVSCTVIKLVFLLNISSSNCMFSEKEWLILAAVLLTVTYPILDVLKSEFSRQQFQEKVLSKISCFIPAQSDFLELCEIFKST